ncbi:16S rRNA (adenine(1518)-N(6)/adenine(1519)-N(6))-dimethyltransferase RsmA [Ferrovum sp. PN-J185]|uniref:16S rRNA (adenine(1518)-N(6)/adenine(1519)-N(6))- dimethyltransferase RsmA n=1 Tax=Ferrovum sp. PN-J185 TaxID=1356306 RepID=UPI001E3C090C|nr:16S rRNA (adenine(1518)-N(6)/adenine(1519)-N(6))-dimethyltransferase RsmA [Ferrovum sp. PN-J185]MCC6067938.1 16S rRNA (adenine(1518)-N(6)/adenine(1519)-N(6))-dimethyltransferase RsmA [Ferrovum sp. PN-J185]
MTKHIARKRFGQHFLVDQSITYNIIKLAHFCREDSVVEIGPGLGALTHPLLKELDHLTLIELDRDLIHYWQQQTQYKSQITIVESDVLQVDFKQFPNHFRLIGNLPYNISTPLLFHLTMSADKWRDAHFMLQKEVVDRLTAQPGSGDYSRLTVMMSYRFHLEHLFDVPPSAFNPPPKVMSAIIRLIPKSMDRLTAHNEKLFAQVVMDAFSQRRKMLRSTLKKWVNESQWEQLAIDPQRRAETLSVDDFVKIANFLCGIA